MAKGSHTAPKSKEGEENKAKAGEANNSAENPEMNAGADRAPGEQKEPGEMNAGENAGGEKGTDAAPVIGEDKAEPGPTVLFVVLDGCTLTEDQAKEAAANDQVVRACESVIHMHAQANPDEYEMPEMNGVIGIPTGEEAEKSAIALADQPEALDAAQAIITRAQAIIAERSKPAPKSVEELAAAQYDRNVQKYGKDFVTAQRGKNTKLFSRSAWVAMGKNKQGWVEINPPLSDK